MIRIIVLFNLKSETNRLTYENWAKSVDSPTVKALSSVKGFSIHRAKSLLGSDLPSPFEFIEILDVSSIDSLLLDISTEAMQSISAQFQEFADNPKFIVTEALT